jgi:octaprenyl-diphosphate synthase
MKEARFLALVEDDLAAALRGRGDALGLAGRHLLGAPRAKRARPRLCLRLARFAGTRDEDARVIAGAAELLHNASLLHDDVVDDGDERRGLPTANRVYGNGVAVLAGDLLITLALANLRELPRAITLDGVTTVATMARAALLELDARGHAALDLAGWREIARGKTGALLGFCGRAVALAAGADERAPRLGELAERLGVAFQMADDLADVSAGTGKPALKDLQERTPGLPTVLACAGSRALRADVERTFAAHPGGVPLEQARRLAALIEDSGAVAAARALLAREVEQATELIAAHERAGAESVLTFAAELTGPRFFVTEGRAA